MLDIIVPVYNEEKILTEKRDYYQTLQNHARVIFVDGGSTDNTVKIAESLGEVVVSARGRGIQKNRGAQCAQSDHLLFLHVDTCIALPSLEHIKTMMNTGSVGGCLTLKIEDDSWIFRLFTKVVNFRAQRFGVVDGDLGLFVKRRVYTDIGGFDPLPYMEDILFSKRLRTKGRVSPLPDTILVSSRKWHTHGFFRTFFKYMLAYVQLWTVFRFVKRREYAKA